MKTVRMNIALTFLVSLFCSLPGLAVAEDLIALQVPRILGADGGEIEGGTILIEGGRIKAVGKGLKIPYNASVIRYREGVVTPGLINPHTTAGLRVANENLPEVPYISVLDGIDPSSRAYRAAMRDGITALHVIPGNDTLFGGQGAVIRPVGSLPEDMVIKSPSALKISLSPSRGETRMAHMARMRKSFFDLHEYLAGLIPPPPDGLLAARPSAVDLTALLARVPDWKGLDWERIEPEKIDEKKRPMADLVRGNLPAFIYCPRATDVFKAFELMDTHGLKATLVLGPDGFRAVEALKKRKDLLPVVLDPQLVHYEDDPETGEEKRYLAARIFFEAGVPFALQVASGGGSRFSRSPTALSFSRDPATHLWYQAARLLQQGIPREEALAAVTRNPARALGLDHRMGSVTVGKDANLVVFTGDPFDVRSWVDLVMIEGKVVYRRSEDKELKELLRRPEKKY